MAYPTDSGNTYATHVTGEVIEANHVNNLQTELGAVKTLLGTVGSVVNGTFYYVNSEITGADKAVGKTATQTLTNKTLTSPSITTPTITTPTITLGSDATGDIFYRNSGGTLARLAIGSANKILRVVAGLPAWDNETALSDASATVKGVVEIATSAEITAGTATGGTGAVLAISPDQLALSGYKKATSTFTADGSITSGNVVAIGTGGNVNIYAPQAQDTSSVATTSIGNTATNWGSLNFTVPAESNMYLRTVIVKVTQPTGAGSISFNADLSVRAVSGGLPTGADLASATQVAVGSTITSITFTFPTPYLLTASTTYALVFRGSTIGTDCSITFWGQGSSTNSGSTWSSAGGGSSAQATTITYGKTTTSGRVFNANANNNDAGANGIVGFALSTVTEGQSVDVLCFGIMTGLSGLTTGSTYYLSNTVGALSSSAGSQSRKIGLALSSTTLLIKHDNV